MRAIVKCLTTELGGRLYACEQCGTLTERFNSCRNRHCPKCQFLDKARWLEEDRVHFRYKDYADGSAWKETSLEAHEFLRRYLMHVLPPGFHRVRYYGLLANRCRAANLERCRVLLGVDLPAAPAETDDGPEEAEPWEEQLHRLTGVDATRCPACKEGRLVYVELLVRQPRRSEAPEPAGRAPP